MKIAATVLLGLLLSTCNNSKSNQQNIPTQKEVTRNMEEVNRQRMRDEDAKIEGYVERRNWPMIKTGTGLRYWIYSAKDSLDPTAIEGQVAIVNYTVSLFNGDTVYSSAELGPREFLIGQDNVESGIHEGIMFMRVGEKAKFVLPSHLAHGLTGDQDRIPPLSSVVYDIELLALK